MEITKMRHLGLVIAFSVAMLVGRTATAGDGCCSAKCPNCDYVCEMTIDHSPVKKYCWKVEYKPICIPKITLPWQRGCGACKGGKDGKGCAGCSGCAKIKYVKVLVKHEYECPSCKCKYTPVPCGKGGKDFAAPAMEGDSNDGAVPRDPPEVRNNYGAPAAPVTDVHVGSINDTDYAVQQASAAEEPKQSLYHQIKDLLK